MARTGTRRRRTTRSQVLRRRRIVFGIVAAGLIALVVLAVVPLVSLTSAWNAAWNTEARRDAVDLTGFDPGTLIGDDDFYDGDAMSADDIQRFLDEQVGRCATDSCLARLRMPVEGRDPVVSSSTGETVCEGFEGGDLSAAEVIDRVQRACGISAKVLLVTLQKEQSLISGRTARAPTERQLGAAMGARCPDDAACDPGAAGFADQVAQGATDLKSYSASDFMRQPGTHYIAYSPDPACGGTDVTITNEATAALYNYTPYQPNPAALAARWGTGDDCSAYGNRNFALYWALWFA
ncbi:hypothetical protein [Microbacterium sp. lyk4-40-TSB-66]|uniref:hypothetical protein n=1 Tax=Microbacterium sp. lyk4-40-TSB-66 TaxID=3040294 RepID=UPI00254B6380|nr:hypothetical protein [Microbacterium sp. lyk4-40-TSB-66]